MALVSSINRRRMMAMAASAALPLAAALRLAAAERPGAEAEAVVTRLVGRLLQLLQNNDGSQSRELMAAIEEETDLRLLARMALGHHWQSATDRQRAAYTALFKSYLLQSFTQRLRRYARSDLGEVSERFRIVDSQKANERDVIVQSKVVPPKGEPLEVAWRLRHRAGGPVIIDLVIEGVSLLVTQRSEFKAVLGRSGVDGLIKELQGRVAQAA